jgi:hypothetical protein
MKIRIDSDEYRCWHEAGHATACLHSGGDVVFVEVVRNARGDARTRCEYTPEIFRTIACGGFAAEFFLLNSGYTERAFDNVRDISQFVFHNTTHDREDYWGRKLGKYEKFSEAEDREFMHHAIGPNGHGGLIPIFEQYFSGMQELVRELLDARRVEGKRVKEILRISS